MTDSMVERVARAIDPEAWGGDASLAMQYPIGRKRVLKRQDDARSVALAALKALQSPTEEMVFEGAFNTRLDELDDRKELAQDVWQAMITEAMKG